MVKIIFSIALTFSLFTVYSQEFEVRKMETGLRGNTYSPVTYQGKIIVCGDQKGSMKSTYKDGQGKNFSQLYIIDTTENGSQEIFDEGFVSNLHDGPISFNKSEDLAAVSKNQGYFLKGKELEKKQCRLGIFFSARRNQNWASFKKFPFNSESFNITHPALSNDGMTLYFASDMPGGEGGFDLYKSVQTSNEWSKPENLGPEVNSDKGEVFPTLVGNSLFFSSNRGKYGGLDIYEWKEAGEAKVLNKPINSDGNDFHMTSSDNMASSIFSSDREGKDEIYVAKSLFPSFEDCLELSEIGFCYLLEEENAMSFDEVPSLIYEWDIQGVKKRGVSVDYCFPGIGEYDIYLNIIDTIVNEVYYEQNYFHLSLQETEQAYITVPNNVAPNESFMVSAERTNLPGKENFEYFWSFDDGTNFRGKTGNHLLSSEGEHLISLGIISTIDNKKYCVTKKINCTKDASTNLDLLHPEKKSTDSKPNGADDPTYVYSIEALKSDSIINDKTFRAGLEKYGNVRIKYIEEEHSYMYLVGEFKNIEEAHPIWDELKKDGFSDAVVKPYSKDELDDFQINKTFVLENMQFDEGSWQIKPNFEKDLLLIKDILTANKTMNILIEAHTDATGTPQYNLSLSKNRAKAVKEYLVKSGIDAKRITHEGLGEAKPIASNDTETGKQKNRRVEFTLR
ncbi:MAG: outer membrane protein OmpA-like peptidoglycan-associated protein [Arenicella sp.]